HVDEVDRVAQVVGDDADRLVLLAVERFELAVLAVKLALGVEQLVVETADLLVLIGSHRGALAVSVSARRTACLPSAADPSAPMARHNSGSSAIGRPPTMMRVSRHSGSARMAAIVRRTCGTW